MSYSRTWGWCTYIVRGSAQHIPCVSLLLNFNMLPRTTAPGNNRVTLSSTFYTSYPFCWPNFSRNVSWGRFISSWAQGDPRILANCPEWRTLEPLLTPSVHDLEATHRDDVLPGKKEKLVEVILRERMAHLVGELVGGRRWSHFLK
jgi:hypothetical protein